MDLDGDGRGDLVSGSYASRVYLWRGGSPGIVGLPAGVRPGGGGGFGAREEAVVLGGDAFKNGHVACHAVDWDGDGDLDLLLGTRRDRVWLAGNAGTPKAPKFAEPVRLRTGDESTPTVLDSGPHAADWDGDGDLDLLVGDDRGAVTLFRNGGSRTEPRLEAGLELLPAKGGRVVEERCRNAEMCAVRAKPWVADWNGDGRPDLLVGDFHDHRVPANMANEEMRGWVWLYLRRPPAERPAGR